MTASSTPTIHGEHDPRFDGVRDAFAATFTAPSEIGAALAITVDGRPVVDLWAGSMDGARTKPWERDTLVTLFSTTKGFTAMCAHRLVDQGLLDLDAPVSTALHPGWSNATCDQESAITLRHLLSMTSGLSVSWAATTNPIAGNPPAPSRSW